MQFIDASQVAAKLNVPHLVEALRRGFQDGCEMPQRHRHTLRRKDEPDANLVLMPAWQDNGALGVKMTTIVPGNSSRNLPSVMPIYVLFHPVTGVPQVIIDGRSLTLHRTAAASALAATYLARKNAARLLMVGTGDLAPYLIRAHATISPIEEVIIWGRRPERAEYVKQSLGKTNYTIKTTIDLEGAASKADVISCATLANDPLISGAWLKPGVHIDLVGGFTPTMREVDDEAVRRARIYADKKEACLAEAGDLIQPIRNGVISEDSVIGDLFNLARGECKGRNSSDEITLFKSVGIGLEDLVAAQLLMADTNNANRGKREPAAVST